ncbi:MAG: hypothetical protein RIQ55_14 [Pseudomonadota bacterium]
MALKLDQLLRILRDPECPRVLTPVDFQQWLALSHNELSEATQKRWLAKMREGGLIKPVRRGLFLNALAEPPVQPDEAASYICRGAIVSLQKVLGDAGVLNNFTSWVTCVVALPSEKKEGECKAFGFARPSTGKVETKVGSFSFQAMPFTLVTQAGALDDRLEPLSYQRATPEKAFLDWIYLGSTPRSHMTLPPLDLDFERLNPARIARLAKGMGLADALDQWTTAKRAYDHSPGARANAPA